MVNADTMIAVVVGIIGFILFFASNALPSGYLPGVPGPGFFPRLISYGLIFLSILLFVNGVIKKRKYFDKIFFSSLNFKYLVYIVLITIAYILAWIFEFGTFIINSILYFSIIIYFFGEKRIVYAIGLSTGITLFTFYFFTRVLRILL